MTNLRKLLGREKKRFKIIEEKKKEQSTNNIEFRLKQLGDKGKLKWKKEDKKERLELQELKENLWSWRERGEQRMEKKTVKNQQRM